MGKAVGGVLGASLGIAGGLEFGSAAAAILIPGVGPVVALGMAAAAVLGAAGAVGGAAVGAALEQDTTPGLPADELFVYKDALRQGRSVLFVQAPDDDQAARVHQALAQEGAETIDAAREEWWIGLRSAEQEHYHGLGGNFAQDEQAYRRGFEEGVRRQHGVAPGETADRDKVTDQDRADDRAFRCGYERGKTWTQGQPR